MPFSNKINVAILLAGFAAAATNASPALFDRSLGINCRGSSDCDFGTRDDLQPIIDAVNTMDDSYCAPPGAQIACADGGITDFCLFTQKTSNTLCGPDIKRLIQAIQDHGCDTCGSVPLGFPGSNDPDNNVGELTVNAASGCRVGSINPDDETGLCPGVPTAPPPPPPSK